jgi:DNA-directed RNA polymerase subunit omega
MEPQQLESLLNKVGGKFKLVSLVQKRMRELQRGLLRLVVTTDNNVLDIVSAEIMESKVDLIMGEEAELMRKELALRDAEEEGAADAAKSEKIKAEKAALTEEKK